MRFWSLLLLCLCTIGMASVHPLQLDVADSTRRSPHALHGEQSLASGWDGPDSSQAPWTSFLASSMVMGYKLFVQTHGMVHLRNVQSHSSSRTTYATHDRPAGHETSGRSRSPVPRRSRVRLTPGPWQIR